MGKYDKKTVQYQNNNNMPQQQIGMIPSSGKTLHPASFVNNDKTRTKNTMGKSKLVQKGTGENTKSLYKYNIENYDKNFVNSQTQSGSESLQLGGEAKLLTNKMPQQQIGMIPGSGKTLHPASFVNNDKTRTKNTMEKSKLVQKGMGENTKSLYKYNIENYDENSVSGQMQSDSESFQLGDETNINTANAEDIKLLNVGAKIDALLEKIEKQEGYRIYDL